VRRGIPRKDAVVVMTAVLKVILNAQGYAIRTV
jgi:hypothetical protein